MEGGERPAKRPIRETESLGWLSESAVQPKKQRFIEGVGAGGLIELRAQLYRTQEQARLVRDGEAERQPRRKGALELGGSAGNGRNAGVEDRNQRDLAQIQTETGREAESRAALERKAALYEKLKAGGAEDDAEQYNVDFLRKGVLGEEPSFASADRGGDDRGRTEPWQAAFDAVGGDGSMRSEDMDRERERRRWEEDARQGHTEEDAAQARRDERVEDIYELNEQLNYEREKAAGVKARRQEQQTEARQKLKTEFLKKQLAQLRAAKAKR